MPSDMMLCVISYWVLSGAKRRQIQQLRCCVLSRQAVEMKEAPAKPYTKIRKSNQNRFTWGANNRPTRPTTLVISGAIIIAEMQHLSDSPQRKNSDATRNGNDVSYFHRKLGTHSSCSSMSFSVILFLQSRSKLF